MTKSNRQKSIERKRRKLRAISPQRRRAMVDSIVGAHLPDLPDIVQGDVEIDVDAMSPAMRQGFLGRIFYDLTRRVLGKDGKS